MKTFLVTDAMPTGGCVSLGLQDAFLVDRPFLLHVVETLIAAGQRDITFLGSGLDETARPWLGDGARWGCEFEYVDCEPSRLASSVRRAASEARADHILLGHACRWMPITGEHLRCSNDELFVDLHVASEGTEDWQGWTIVPREWLEDLSTCDWTETSALVRQLNQSAGVERLMPTLLDASSERSLLRSQWRVLHSDCPELALYGRELVPGIRQCRNVRIHRTARLQGPILLGDDVWIGKGVEIGPGTVIGHGSVIDRDTRIERSLVMPRTLVDPRLHLVDCWVDARQVRNVRVAGAAPSSIWQLTSAV